MSKPDSMLTNEQLFDKYGPNAPARNEAAERLRDWLNDGLSTTGGDDRPYSWLDEALAAEYRRGLADGASDNVAVADRTRRATVERIRERVAAVVTEGYSLSENLLVILDDEAAR